MNEHESATAVVTGAASGLGKDIAEELAAKGYTVYGTTLSSEPASGNPRIVLSRVDITNPDAVRTWAENVAVKSGGKVNLLINNAGILTPGPLELVPLDAIRQEFEVNTFAPLTVVNAFLPQLRAAQGRIVQISTISAVFPMAFNAPSAASKIAVEALMKAYRTELHRFGVEVTIIQPGSMLTGGPAKSAALLGQLTNSLTDDQRELYGEALARFAAGFNDGQAKGLTSAAAAAEVIDIAERIPAPSTATIGDDAAQLVQFLRTSTAEEQDALRLTLA
ncbi:SDR family NAD(P)-dependent oxidoreductase [Salinibacterium sp. SWN1162]|uniref:SDR family NAD(P)-dependent oxidoreductase n=1 Tax=Salinibacterium sp. SWN1162 TaxID=2792053 RepID=UPI0018CD4EB7|nr:SDR family NAD(P)-dependent oxidoreductase [Salinibacterium sp. SWN1162]MBH0008062.1 SDR family NAD(P)-dependent oxidoreductase [Salinibacterium sp. SWN1162]